MRVNDFQGSFISAVIDTLRDFQQASPNEAGTLGITPETDTHLALLEGRVANPFTDIAYQPPAEATVTLKEAGSRTFTLALSAVSDEDRTVTLSIDSLADRLVVIVGDAFVAFEGGAIEIPVPASQHTVSFGLWAREDVDADALLQLTATWVDPAAGETVSHGLTLSYKARLEPDVPVIEATTIIFGNLEGVDEIDLQGSAAHHVITGGGEDAVISDQVRPDGIGDWIELGTGADSALGSPGDDHIAGGPGNDYIVGGHGVDLLEGGLNRAISASSARARRPVHGGSPWPLNRGVGHEYMPDLPGFT
jgi:Ca2+-binding RTX toxin-like protein